MLPITPFFEHRKFAKIVNKIRQTLFSPQKFLKILSKTDFGRVFKIFLPKNEICEATDLCQNMRIFSKMLFRSRILIIFPGNVSFINVMTFAKFQIECNILTNFGNFVNIGKLVEICNFHQISFYKKWVQTAKKALNCIFFLLILLSYT